MRRALTALVVGTILLGLSAPLGAQRTPVGGVAPSSRILLDGRWDLLLDPDVTGIPRGVPTGTTPAWQHALKVQVPGPWETQTQAVGHDGVAWYRLTLPAAPTPPGGRLWLVFDEADWRAEAWLDGQGLGRHDGPGAFRFDVSGKLDDAGHVLVVRVLDPGEKKVEDLLLGALPTGRQAWFYNTGGLIGAVSLLPTGLVELARPDARVLPDGAVQVRVLVRNHGEEPRELLLSATLGGASGGAQHSAPPGESEALLAIADAQALPRWSPDTPTLLPLEVTATDDKVAARVEGRAGLRRFAAVGAQFTLDGQPLRLRGVGLPPGYPKGLTQPHEESFLRRDLGAIKAAGFNLVRVEQDIAPEVYAACDELGLLVQAEPPLGRITYELPVTAPAVDAALVATAEAVQGHPSVVLVSLLDEGGGLLWRHADELLARAQVLLPERLLLSDSGGASGRASLANPHEPAPVPYHDVRWTEHWPWRDGERAEIDALGEDGRLVYVSRWSASGLPSFVENVAGFNNALSSEDAAVAVQRLQDASTQFAGTPLSQVVRDLPALTTLGQAAQARAMRSVGTALRDQPRLAGDCYASWRDLGWRDAEGLCDLWGRPKPALGALSRPAPPAPMPELASRKIQPLTCGSLVGLGPVAQEIISKIMVRPDAPEAAGLPRIAVVGSLRPLDWTGPNQAVTVALLRFARDGGTVLLLDPLASSKPLPGAMGAAPVGQLAHLPVDVSARPVHGVNGAGLLIFADKSPLLADLPLDLPVLDDRLAAVAPERVLYAPTTTGLRVELGCVDPSGRYVGAAVQSVPYGKGTLVLSTLRFEEEDLADQAVMRLLRNVVRCAAGIASRRPPPATAASEPPGEALRDPVQQHVWHYALWFGLAERMATARIPDLRPVPRADPHDLATMLLRKNTGLDLIVQGRAAEGDKVLALIDDKDVGDDRELFVRDEVSLFDALRSCKLSASARGELLAGHARALRLLRLGENKAALERMTQTVADARRAAKPPVDDGAADADAADADAADADAAGDAAPQAPPPAGDPPR